ncbi:MAG: hypothetical protein KAJ19_16845, partial [Gammaproteobacteria bacterium]|nr:hypothetical protein [Gammaproteobacteria bacterium]
MRKMAKGTRARWLARVVCLLFVAPLLAMGPASQRADAQEVTTTFKIIPVAVLDFANKTPYQAGFLGRQAADAVVVALDGSQRFEPLQRDQVKRALQELGLRVPLSDAAQQRLGKHLEVAGVISGEVREVTLIPGRDGMVARVTMGAVMVDVATGEPVNGALVASHSSPKPGYSADRDVLINEALREAAFEIVQAMLSYQAPQVLVQSADPNHAFLKGGTRSGLRLGMEM